jgi:uncharacterized SAM-dependent methyltransferase
VKTVLKSIFNSLKFKKNISPKYFYFGKGAYNWAQLSRDKKYKLGQEEELFIIKSIDNVINYVNCKNISLIDLGPGSGKKAIDIIRKISKDKTTLTYSAFDISREILRIAEKNIYKSFNAFLRASYHLIDFEDETIRPLVKKIKIKYNYPVLIALLGSGNVTNKNNVMTNIRNSMDRNDWFLLSTEILNSNNTDRILSHYKNKHALKVVFYNLKRLGLKEKDGQYDIRFNKRKSQIEIYFIFSKNVVVHAQGNCLKIKKDTKVQLFTSFKPTKRLLTKYLEKMGFAVKIFKTDKKDNLALVLCKRNI